MVDMQVIVRRQDQKLCASITCMIRHYVARKAKVIFDHPHNADERILPRDVTVATSDKGTYLHTMQNQSFRTWGARKCCNSARAAIEIALIGPAA